MHHVRAIVENHVENNTYSTTPHLVYSKTSQVYTKGRNQYDEMWYGSKDSTFSAIKNGNHFRGPGSMIIKNLLLELLD